MHTVYMKSVQRLKKYGIACLSAKCTNFMNMYNNAKIERQPLNKKQGVKVDLEKARD